MINHWPNHCEFKPRSTLRFILTGYTHDHLSQVAIICVVLFLVFFGVCYKKQTISISALYLKKTSYFTIFKIFYSTLYSQIRDCTSADIYQQRYQAPSGSVLLFRTNKHCMESINRKCDGFDHLLYCYTRVSQIYCLHISTKNVILYTFNQLCFKLH